MKKVNKKKGFTLVELAIVIAVIAILAAILVPTLTTVLGKANKTKDTTAVNKIIQAYVTDNADDEALVEKWASNTPYYVVYNNKVFKVVSTASTELEVGTDKDYTVTGSGDSATYTIKEVTGKTYKVSTATADKIVSGDDTVTMLIVNA